MPALEELKKSEETDNIRASLEVAAYSYPNQNLSTVQRLNSLHSANNVLLEYLMMLKLNTLSGDLQRKIKLTGNLRPNWDTYGAEPPDAEAVNTALEVLVSLEHERFLPSDAVASTEGGVALCFVAGDRYADIEILNSGEILAVTVTGQQDPYVWEVGKNTRAFSEAIERIRNHIRA